jgi:pimeloyl-ACP methyl ester carboxylesterase
VGGTTADPSVDSYDDLVEWVQARLTRPSVLVAQSMGGYVALRVALSAPELVTHLVLAVTSGGLDGGAPAGSDWRSEGRREHPHDPSWLYEPQPSLEPMLSAIHVPVLLVWADRDPISPLVVGEQLHGLLEQSTLVVYDSDDHWVARVNAVDVAQRVRQLVYSG